MRGKEYMVWCVTGWNDPVYSQKGVTGIRKGKEYGEKRPGYEHKKKTYDRFCICFVNYNCGSGYRFDSNDCDSKQIFLYID